MATAQQMRQSYYTNIEKNTGISIADWLIRIRALGPRKHSEIVNWLKAEHGMGHGHATLLAYDTLHTPAAGQEQAALSPHEDIHDHT